MSVHGAASATESATSTSGKGHKPHLDVTDMGIPVTAVATGAKVHGSQVEIPMEKLADRQRAGPRATRNSAHRPDRAGQP